MAVHNSITQSVPNALKVTTSTLRKNVYWLILSAKVLIKITEIASVAMLALSYQVENAQWITQATSIHTVKPLQTQHASTVRKDTISILIEFANKLTLFVRYSITQIASVHHAILALP